MKLRLEAADVDQADAGEFPEVSPSFSQDPIWDNPCQDHLVEFLNRLVTSADI
jgi:hypothetical protein